MIPIRPGDRPGQYRLRVTPQLCVGHPDALFLFGGCGLATGLAAIEAETGRRVVWAAAQYLSYAAPDTELVLDVTVPVHGRYTTQARVTARAGDTEILTVAAALGARPDAPERQWATLPDGLPAPADCPAMTYDWVRHPDDLNASFDKRIVPRAPDAADDGTLRLWMRPADGGEIGRGTLAIMADFLPAGVGNALGVPAGGNSLDNTIRFMRLVPTPWVLAEIRIHAIADGFAHGRAHLFAMDGTLLATASQSMILRIRG